MAISDGDVLIVEAKNGVLKARRGNSVVANFDNPARDLVDAISGSGGAAYGVVKRVHRLSKKVEVSLC